MLFRSPLSCARACRDEKPKSPAEYRPVGMLSTGDFGFSSRQARAHESGRPFRHGLPPARVRFCCFACHLFSFRDHVWVMNMILMDTATASDEQLWRLACEGDREAFGRIVERYQALVCSPAYRACGTLGTSEDMAQDYAVGVIVSAAEANTPVSNTKNTLCTLRNSLKKRGTSRYVSSPRRILRSCE